MVNQKTHTPQSALQAYGLGAGQVPKEQSFGLLRKARRLEDRLVSKPLAVRLSSEGPVAPSVTTTTTTCCVECLASASPKWYKSTQGQGQDAAAAAPAAGGDDDYICHQCYFRNKSHTTD